MKRHLLLICGALVLSIIALVHSPALSHIAAAAAPAPVIASPFNAISKPMTQATTLKGNTLTVAANIGTPTAEWLIASGAPAPEVCQNFLGRAREKVCQTKPGYDACLVLLKQGTVDFCALGGDANSPVRRTTKAEAETSLIQKGCKKSIFGNIYTCETIGSSGWCTSYKNFFELMQTPKPSPVAGCKVAAAAVPLYHFYELQKDYFHFYTANQDEAAALKKQKGWKYVGITGYVLAKQKPGTVPLFRMVKSEFGGTNHFYTTNLDEANAAINNGGWTAEGIVGYVAPTQFPGTVPLYRLYLGCQTPNDGKFRGPCEDANGGDVHYLTVSGEDKNTAVYNGMTFIRIEAWVWTQP